MTVPVHIGPAPRAARQSTINNGDTCHKRLEYAFYHDVPRRGSVNRGVGTGYHAGLATYYGARMRLGDSPKPTMVDIWDSGIAAFDEDVAANASYDWRFQVKGYRNEERMFKRADAVEMIQEALSRYFNEGHQWPPEWTVVGVEHAFDQAWIPGWNRSGTMDLVLVDGAGTYILVDHKTAKKKWPKGKNGPSNPQAAWYMEAWRVHAGLTLLPEFWYDVIGLTDGSFERRHAPRTPQQVELTLLRAADTFKLIDQGGPFLPNTDSYLCSEAYCDYWSVCPYGRGLSFVEVT